MSLKVKHRNYQLYLFDCDGTVADTMGLHYKAWSLALSPFHCKFPRDLFLALAGMPTIAIVEKLNERFGLQMNPQEVDHLKETHFLELLPTVKPVQIVQDFLFSLLLETPKVIVSGGPTGSVTQTIEYLGLSSYFSGFVCAEDYARGKPHPDPFLTAARKFNTPADQCLVLEDAELGIQAAKAAGMDWVRVPLMFGLWE